MSSGVPAVPSLQWHGLSARRSESARSVSRLLANAPDVAYGVTHSKDIAETPHSQEVDVTFESAIKEVVAFAASSAIAHISCAVYSRSTVTEKDSKRAIVGSTESQQLYPTAVDSYCQTVSAYALPICFLR